jgi:hypothetical protein
VITLRRHKFMQLYFSIKTYYAGFYICA